MKGIIFNLLEDVVTTHLGEEAWDEVLDSAGVGGSYTSLGNYDDAEFVALLGAISARTGQPVGDTLRWFGHKSMPFLAKRYTELFSAHHGLRSFLLSLNDVIHAEVRKLYPGAEVPVFEFETPSDEAGHDSLHIHYRSKRRLCLLAEGFIAGAADCFAEKVTVSQRQCMHDGADHCILVCQFGKRGAS